MAYLVACVVGYLLGCSNLAFYLAKAKGVDLSANGSGNPGASNATILMGWKAGVAVGAHDIGKALLAVILTKLIFPQTPDIAEIAGAACVLGHMFPFYLKFRGGKGFASYIGMMVALNWQFALIVLAAVVLVTVIFDYLVIGTTLTVVSLPIFLIWVSAGWIAVLAVCIASGVILFKHRMNYVRIWNKTEIGLRSTLKGEHRIK